AGFAAAAFYVEAEAAGAIATLARFREHGEELAYRSENAGVSGGIGARSAANGRLVDFDDFFDVLHADDAAMSARRLGGAIELLRESAIKDVVDESGFSGAGNAGNNGEKAERKIDVELLQIVGGSAENLDGFAVWAATRGGNRNGSGAGKITTGERGRAGGGLIGLALRNEIAARGACAGTEIGDEIGAPDGGVIG